MAKFNVVCNETNEVMRDYPTKGGATRYANFAARVSYKNKNMTFRVEPVNDIEVLEADGWLASEDDPTAQGKDFAHFAYKNYH